MALTLSDAFCVDRYRDEFLDLMRKGTVDIVFANEGELQEPLSDRRLSTPRSGQLRNDAKFAAVTRSEHGCVVVAGRRASPRCRRSRSTSWSIRPAPAICLPPGSWWGFAREADHTTCGKFRRPRRRGGHPAHRRAPAAVAQGPRRGERVKGLASSGPPDLKTYRSSWPACPGHLV